MTARDAKTPIEAPVPIRKYRSAEEGVMRVVVAQHLRANYPGARIIHEFPLRYSSNSLDMAAVLPHEIVGVEIKSSKDVIDRLERQLRAFAPICSRIIVALAPRWNEKSPDLARVGRAKTRPTLVGMHTEAQTVIDAIRASHIETWTCRHETGVMKNTAGGYSVNHYPWPAQMLDMLHVRELERILAGRDTVPSRPRSHEFLKRICLDRMTGPRIVKEVCAALRARAGFAKESDASIEWTTRGVLFEGPP